MTWGKTLFVMEFLYGITLPLQKTAVLLLHFRLFYIHRWCQLTNYVLIITIWLWGISDAFIAIFQCKPIAFQWDKTIQGTCINQIGYYRWIRLPNIIHDVVILVLHILIIWKLRIAVRQKIALISVFAFGSL